LVVVVASNNLCAFCSNSFCTFLDGMDWTFPAAGLDDLFYLAGRMALYIYDAGWLDSSVSFDTLEKIQN
jgi:hypothetical protein